MKYRKQILTASISACLFAAAAAHAQDAAMPSTTARQNTVQAPDGGSTPATQQTAPAPADPQGGSTANPDELNTIVVLGIRESLKKSLEKKRDSDDIIDAITAEDIGKFPATNIAEALAQVPGVTIDRVLGSEQRVSIDGTDPSLNLSFLDGHPVAQAIWLYGDSPNRGFNFSLLAPEALGSLEIYKTPEATLPEGSLGGTIMMHTVEPLDVATNSISGSIGYNYNDMVDQGKPDASIFYSWKNDDHTFGIDVAAQHYEQITNREGEEIFGYNPVSFYAATNPAIAAEVAAGTVKSTDLVPNELNFANFQQTEKRDSVFSNIQWKPNDRFELDLGLMDMRDNLDNYNQSLYPFWAWTNSTVAGVQSFTPGPGGVVSGGTNCDPHTTSTCPGVAASVFDNNARTAVVETRGADLRASYKGDGWKLSMQTGFSTSHDDITQAFIEPVYFGGYSWNINHGVTYTNPSAAQNPANWSGYYFNGNYADIPYNAKDNYTQFDFSKDLGGFFNELKVGVRFTKHNESQPQYDVWSGGVQGGSLAQVGAGSLTNLTGLADLGFGPGSTAHVQPINGPTVINWVLGSPNLFQPQFLYAPYLYEDSFWVAQSSDAAYAQLNFGNDDLRGNFGVRFVHTAIDETGFVIDNTNIVQSQLETIDNAHNNALPSFNLAYTLSPDVILRFAASQVIAWAPYNQETPYVVTNDSVLTGSGGNPFLDPYKSNNFNLGAEYYFAPESVVAASFFYKDILNYIVQGVGTERLYNSLFVLNPSVYAGLSSGDCDASGFCNYSITRPVNGGKATAKGLTLSYQQPFGDTGFGLRANYTYSDASTRAGGDLPYNSKDAVNLTPYYDKGQFSGSLSYGYRSSYLAGGYVAGAPAETINGYKELDGNIAWRFTDHLSVSFDGLNLLNSTYLGYLGTKFEPVAEYKSGREYLATLHFKF
jgi:iron complex outermembrane recepter protein